MAQITDSTITVRALLEYLDGAGILITGTDHQLNLELRSLGLTLDSELELAKRKD